MTPLNRAEVIDTADQEPRVAVECRLGHPLQDHRHRQDRVPVDDVGGKHRDRFQIDVPPKDGLQRLTDRALEAVAAGFGANGSRWLARGSATTTSSTPRLVCWRAARRPAWLPARAG